MHKCYGSHLELADVEKAVPIHLVTGYIHRSNKFQFVLVVYFAISQWPHQLYIHCQKKMLMSFFPRVIKRDTLTR